MEEAGPREPTLDAIDHVALCVPNVPEAVEWYTRHFRCRVRYCDPTWALLEFANTRLALVVPQQHPPHIAFVSPEAERFGPLRPHRDGTRSAYIRDLAGNSIEILAAEAPGSAVSDALPGAEAGEPEKRG